MFDKADIQIMINHVITGGMFKRDFCDQLDNANISGEDRRAINEVLVEGWAELFDSYDSAVCEEFINIYLATDGHLFNE